MIKRFYSFTQFALLLSLNACTTQTIQPAILDETIPANPAEQSASITEPSGLEITSIPAMENCDPAVVQSNLENSIATFKQSLSGWVNIVTHRTIYSEQNQSYTDLGETEEWYLLETDRKIFEGYSWINEADSTYSQESYYSDGYYTQLDTGKMNMQPPTGVFDPTVGFVAGFSAVDTVCREQVTYQDRAAWKFSYELNDGAYIFTHAVYFDQSSSVILGLETWLNQPDDSLKLVSEAVYVHFEVNASPPQDHFDSIKARLK